MTSTRHGRRLRVTVTVAVCASLLVGCTATPGRTSVDTGWTEPTAGGTVGVLPTASVAGGVPSRLAQDLAPPTNRWYSGLVFGDVPQPVYPFPLAFAIIDGGFALDLPKVTTTDTTVAALFEGGLGVELGIESFEVVRYDAVSVTLRVSDGDGEIGDITVAEGSPVVAFTAGRDARLTTSADLTQKAAGLWTTDTDGTRFGVVAPEASVEAGDIALAHGSSAQFFALPDDADPADWAAALAEPITRVDIAHSASDSVSSTRLTYAGTSSTVVAAFPGHEPNTPCSLGTFRTAYGDAPACATTTLEWGVDRLAARAAYDMDDLVGEARDVLAAQIEQDLAATMPVPADTYYGGKALARLGALLSLARSLDEDALADRIADRLQTELEPWVDQDGCRQREERCFVYDDALHLVVGKVPSFGSELGNDHHFHYGYFLAAAAALAEARPASLDRLTPVIDALAADIAAGATDPDMPVMRVFDPYRGHSWAGGLSPFADGNNQESSSEAVAAWNGLALWASVRGDSELQSTAGWMLSAEADSARALWLEPELTDLPSGFAHSMFSLTWSGKRDYATWFSAEPSAILGIQILPVGPISLDYLAGDPERVARNVADAGGSASFEGALGEYVLLYSALGGPDALAAAESSLASTPPDALDDGTSPALMLAWLAAVKSESVSPHRE